MSVSADGVEAAPGRSEQSPETYFGYHRSERFASLERLTHDSPKTYSSPGRPSLNQWALSGSWNVGGESAALQTAAGRILFRFHSRDLHMVLAPTKQGEPVRFKVTLDGAAPLTVLVPIPLRTVPGRSASLVSINSFGSGTG